MRWRPSSPSRSRIPSCPRSSASRPAASNGGSPSSCPSALGASADRHDGVCANIEFPFPGRLVGIALAAATGVDPDDDPWLPERSVWPLMDVVDDHLGDGWLAALAAHLGGAGADRDETRQARRFGAVRHLADLFDRYGLHRPTMIEAWVAGDDTDGDGAPLPPDVAWQAPLWRHLRERIGTPSPAERARHRLRPAARRPRRSSTCHRGWRSSASPAWPPATSTCSTRSPPRVTSTSSCSTPPRPVGTHQPSRRRAASPRAPPRRPHRRARAQACKHAAQPAARHVGTRRPRDAARHRRPRTAPTSTIPPTPHPTRCCDGSRPTSAPTSPHRVLRSRASRTSACSSTRATTASRCTPATGGRARSRSSATRSCTCSPTTRRSSRVTSS